MTTRLLTPRRRALLTGAALATVVATGAAACGGSSSGGQPADAASPSSGASSTGSVTTIGTAQGDGGTYLVDGDGRTLYLFEADKSTTSTCSGPCADQWPPVTVTATPDATGAVMSDMLGTTKRDDGAKQLTYAGHPLYRFSGDTQPGDTNGAGSEAFGAEWYPVTPAGETLEGDESEENDDSGQGSSYSYPY